MALIVAYHVVADMFPMGTTPITAGMLVKFHTDGTVIPATAHTDNIIGIAGDSDTTAGPNNAYSASLHLGAATTTDNVTYTTAESRYTQNRVSDFYNETAASGKITVYHGGGKFYTDQYLASPQTTFAPGVVITAGEGGQVDGYASATTKVGYAVAAPAAFSSGVPGTDTLDNSISLGTMLPIILKV
jgi:hypothetical protein